MGCSIVGRHPRARAIAYGNIGDGEELSYPPLEGEGRPNRTKHSFFRFGRGGVIVHPQPIHPALLAAHPTPALRADPPPPGEGKGSSPSLISSYAIALRHGRACPGHPRPSFLAPKTWVA